MAQFTVSNIFNYVKSKKKERFAIPEKVWQDPLYFIAFGFGSGTIPFAPGTFGTLMAIPFYLLMRPLSLYPYLLVTLLVIIGSSWISQRVSSEIAIHDHPGMCVDEFAGFFVTMIAAPIGWIWILLGFILFRIFDILKPWPINYIDKNVHGGFGMILDDVVAGGFACICIQLLKLGFVHG